MFAGSPRLSPAESLAPLAEPLADALALAGDGAAADTVLALAGRHGADPELALRRGERALARGDAAAALEAMVPAWEAGFDDPRLDARLAFASLCLGLYDVAGALTDAAEALDGRLVRWLLDVWEGDAPVAIDWRRAEAAWALKSLLRQLERCGRDDIAARGWRAAVEANRALADRLGPAPAEPPSGPARPPMGGREAFCAAWSGPAADAVYSWAWSVGREVQGGERVLLLSPTPAALRPLVAHGRAVALSIEAVEGCEAVVEPSALPVAPARWQHVVAALWLEHDVAPVEALRSIAGALTHEGRLHLLCAGPAADAALPMRLSAAMVERACRRAGLTVTGVAARTAEGMPAEPGEAAVLLVQAERRLV